MKQKTKILLVGNIYTIHIRKLISHMNRLNPKIEFDIFNSVECNDTLPDEAKYFNNIFSFKRHFPLWMYRIPILNTILFCILDTILSLSKQLSGKKYKLINIHSIGIESFFLMPIYKQHSNTVMSSPWGSDMYRKKGVKKFLTKRILSWSDYVSAPKIQFREDIKTMYKVPETKFIELGFGADAIDLLSQNIEISRDVAKQNLNISENYIITIGYNGSKAQNHLKIIEAVKKVRKELPEKIYLLLPMTYGASQTYISKVRNALIESKIPFKIFDEFLNDRELVHLRKSSDMFVHAQPSDAFSASLQEYFLCDTIIVNGKWTRYPDFEKFGIPYYIFNSFEELPEKMLKAYKNEDEIYISSQLKEYVKNKGWRFMSEKWCEFYVSL